MKDNKQSQHELLKSQISQFRNSGNISGAILLCKKAMEIYGYEYFYPKIMGDLYNQQHDYAQAAEAFLIFFKRINNKGLFSDFAKRYYRLKRNWGSKKIQTFANKLLREISSETFDKDLRRWTGNLIRNDIEEKYHFSANGQELKNIITNKNFNAFINKTKIIEKNNSLELEFIFDEYILNKKREKESYRIDFQCISIYERFQQFDKALKIANELLYIKFDHTLVRSIFRICRKINNYTAADKSIKDFPKILKSFNFNILYELIYYYKYNNNSEALVTTLKRMERSGHESIPIQKTVRNFYISFGMLSDARRIEGQILNLNKDVIEKGKFFEEVSESEAELISRIEGHLSEIKGLHSREEHLERLAAISDLTTGISHELGQPITNIRYTIQFYYKLFEKSISKEDVFEVFDSILEETRRMGDLMKRLSPLTSSRNVIEKFNLIERIERGITAKKVRIEKAGIAIFFDSTKRITVVGDPIHFDQIINNLLLNAIDSMNQRKTGDRKIAIQVTKKKNNVILAFTDSGPGIKARYRGKIFDPFFTTKAPGKGEGLGLFIIWNLLKIHGGRIELDAKYNLGAKFILTIPKISRYERK